MGEHRLLRAKDKRTAQKGESFFYELTFLPPSFHSESRFQKLNIKDETEPSDWSAAVDGEKKKKKTLTNSSFTDR